MSVWLFARGGPHGSFRVGRCGNVGDSGGAAGWSRRAEEAVGLVEGDDQVCLVRRGGCGRSEREGRGGVRDVLRGRESACAARRRWGGGVVVQRRGPLLRRIRAVL